jgi:hypothetical protein
MTACSHCGTEFRPQRRSARFCGSTCRVAAHRKTDCNANSAAEKATGAANTSQNDLQVSPARSEQINTPTITKPLSVTGWRIIPDSKWPGMYRLRHADGTLSDMTNIARARDALAANAEGRMIFSNSFGVRYAWQGPRH